jgi:hypothetical protein
MGCHQQIDLRRITMDWMSIISAIIALLPSLAAQLPTAIADITAIIDEIIAVFQPTPPPTPAGTLAKALAPSERADMMARAQACRAKCIANASKKP